MSLLRFIIGSPITIYILNYVIFSWRDNMLATPCKKLMKYCKNILYFGVLFKMLANSPVPWL